jgi:hypothetical protein
LYNFIIRLVPPYLYEADAWFSIIRKLKYTKVVLIYSQEEESRMVASRFQMLTDDSEIQVNFSIKKLDYFIFHRLNEWKNMILILILHHYYLI